MRILLVHGWGSGPSLWGPLRAALPGPAWLALDLGYFGPARREPPAGLDLVVAHSFGCLWALGRPELAGLPLVAVNGFPRFCAGPDFPHGTPVRVLERMLTRFRAAPLEVLGAFHARCGTGLPPGTPRLARRSADLVRLRDDDARHRLGGRPLLACAAADDPLVPEPLARAAFGAALRLQPGGGHGLPLTRPRAVAAVIREGLGG